MHEAALAMEPSGGRDGYGSFSPSSPSSSCRIYYASQSGRAKACARRAARLLWHVKGQRIDAYASLDEGIQRVRTHFGGSVVAASSLVIMFVSTTGDGEQPDNMKLVWRQLYVRRGAKRAGRTLSLS
jgi:sulfite reductase alpha subunit-like flavoprotein